MSLAPLLASPTLSMTLKVTMHVYSGRPDPFFYLPADGAQELVERIGRISTESSVPPPGKAGGLGYRGFSIGFVDSPLSWFVHEGIVDLGHAAENLMEGGREIEQWLFDVGSTVWGSVVGSHVADSLAKPAQPGSSSAGSGGCPRCNAVDAPPLNLAIWNTPTVQPKNNCYNYANNQMTNTFAQPGNASGKPITSESCSGVQPSAESDGLVATSNFSGALAKNQGFYVALVIWPGEDFHWYRQDSNGCWSHKPGKTAARNTDNKGAAISDPKTCDRGPYTDFCSFMITKSTVKIS